MKQLNVFFPLLITEAVQSKLETHNDTLLQSKEKIFNLNTTISSLEEKLQAALIKAEQTTSLLQQKQLEHDLHESERKNELTRYQELDEQKEANLNGCRQKIKELEESAIKEKEMFHSERKKLVQELKKVREATDENTLERETSPTSMGGQSSMHDSLNSNNWQMVRSIENYVLFHFSYIFTAGRPGLRFEFRARGLLLRWFQPTTPKSNRHLGPRRPSVHSQTT
jgi:chromosome segregation ATPase